MGGPGGGGEGGAYRKNRDQIINVGMTVHASSEDTRVLGGCGGIKVLEMH